MNQPRSPSHVPFRWEHTIDSMSVLEEISSDTLVFLQVRFSNNNETKNVHLQVLQFNQTFS